MKNLIYIFCTISILFTACKNNTSESKTAEDVIQEAHETTAVIAKEGRGKISLQYGSKTMEINGVCGAITTMGSIMIAVRDDSVPAKAFTINFSSEELPSTTSSYNIVNSVSDDKNALEVSLSFVNMSSNVKSSWYGNNKTGKLEFKVNGNEVTCTFSNLTVQPDMLFNKGEFDTPATISGELTIFKE
jgi:hypothetical protein